MQYLQKLGTLKAEYMQAFGIKQGATEKAEGQGVVENNEEKS